MSQRATRIPSGQSSEYRFRIEEYRQRYLARKAAGLCTRHGCPSMAAPNRTQCEKHRERSRWKAAARKAAAIASGTALACVLTLFASISGANESARVSEPPAAPPVVAKSATTVESKYCARADEPLEERIVRLETALRLAKAEAVVNRGRRAKGR